MTLPQPWSDNGSILSANGFQVSGGFRAWMQQHNYFLGVPISRAWLDSGTIRQLFTYGELGFVKGSVYLVDVGENLAKRVLQDIPALALTPDGPPPAPADPNKVKLARTQHILGTNTLGVYFGTWTVNFRAPQFVPYVQQAKARGFDYAMIKFGEWGNLWYDGTERDIAQVFTDHGMKMVPFWYCRPQTWQQDMQQCARLAEEFGVIDLDVEEVFLNIQNGSILGAYGPQLQGILNGIRKAAPEALIIADGYGDPVRAFGSSYPSYAYTAADCYQPQWYCGFWGAKTWSDWNNLLRWGDSQCAQMFEQARLGLSFPIRPCVNTLNVSPDVAYQIGHYLSWFDTGLMLWEFSQCPAATAQAFKAGLIAGAASHSAASAA